MSLRRISDNFKYTNLSRYNVQINLLQPNSTPLSDGSQGAPTTYASGVWAAIRLMRLAELDKAEITAAATYYDVRIPFDANVTDEFTVVAPGGAQWYVESVGDVDGRQVELKLMCRVTDDGK